MRTLRIEDIISLAGCVYIYLDRIYFSRVSAISRRDIVQVKRERNFRFFVHFEEIASKRGIVLHFRQYDCACA